VEDRNFEIRKDVLKYDEVMNEQRKIIYRRRQQILDGGDLHAEAQDAFESNVERIIALNCPGEYVEQWDLPELLVSAQSFFPTTLTLEDLQQCVTLDELRGLLLDAVEELYAAKEESIGEEGLREIERRVMLSVIDQHWREHLYEMDYLREGINLRAMGQRDPLSEWQREGFDMFEAMIGLIEDDFVRYVTHLQIVVDEPAPSRPVRRDRRRERARRDGRDDARRGTRRCRLARSGARSRRPAAGQGRKDPWSQRALLLRKRQEVQALSRPVTPAASVRRSRRARRGSVDRRAMVHGRRMVPARATPFVPIEGSHARFH
jgi:preprotein translocase subunit SecA